MHILAEYIHNTSIFYKYLQRTSAPLCCTNSIIRGYCQLTNCPPKLTLAVFSQSSVCNLTHSLPTQMALKRVIRTNITFGWGPVMSPIGCLQEEVFNTISDLRRWCGLQPPVDDQATSSHSHNPLLTARRAVEEQRGSSRNNIQHGAQTNQSYLGRKHISVWTKGHPSFYSYYTIKLHLITYL